MMYEKKSEITEIIRVIQYGLGPIGSRTARLVVERRGLELVGGVDIDPSKLGKDVGEAISLGCPLGFDVVKTISQLKGIVDADVVLHTTTSYMSQAKSQILEILDAGFNIISTSEELVFPWLACPEDAVEIDLAAKKVGKTVLSTGVNPGFLMDSLPLKLTAICQYVERIDVQRVINASARRRSFQAKIGAGLTVEEFNKRMTMGKMGHVGLAESVGMVFDTLGLKLIRCDSNVDPIIAIRPIRTDYFSVQPGVVLGLRQVVSAYTEDGVFLTLTFIAALDGEDEKDTITIMGRPTLEIELRGTNGDLATAAIVVNATRRILEANPGLVTMRDLPLVSFWQ